MTAIQRFALHGTIMNPHSSGPYVRHEDHLAAMQARCLAQIEEPAGAAPAAVAPFGYVNAHTGQFFTDVEPCRQGNEGHWRTVYLQPADAAPLGERQWICPTRTVADLVNNLLTMDQALPIYGAQYIERDGRRCAIAVPPTVSRERVKDGRWIGQGEELNAAVVWTRAEQPAAAPGLTDGQLDDESYRVNDEPGFSDAFRAGARFAERVHGVTASAARAVTGKADWWRGRADEIEAQVARSGSKDAMRCYTDMRTLLQAAAPALEAPAADLRNAATQALADLERAAGKIASADALRAALAAAPQAPAAPAVDADPLGLRDVGEALMRAIERNADALKAAGWTAPMDCPSEIVVDLLNLLDEAKASPAIVWPKARDVGRIGDMSPNAHLRIGLDSDNDVYASIYDERGGGSIEFCTPGQGGGKSSRTRMALLAVMVAMEADNAADPGRDWWAERKGAAQAAAKGEHGND